MQLLYNAAIHLYSLGVKTAACFGHAKARQWVEGRQRQKRLSLSKSPMAKETEEWIWFHAASLGEFEQGRPVIEAIKAQFPQFKILLSFFSPSGYEIRKNYPLADEVLYLPTDTPKHAKAWVQRHRFAAAFFIKYEFWFNYMQALQEANIPLFYIALILKPDAYFFKWYGTWFRKRLKTVDYFFVQDDTTANLLKHHGMTRVTVCGDTRFDRVATIARQAKPFPDVEHFINGRNCIIAGSTWPPDERLLAAFLPKLPDDYCLIVAPHDISESHIAQIEALFPKALRFTKLNDRQQPESSSPSKRNDGILIINTIGILSQLYQYARLVYIGGGFGVNIHNIQEPVTFGCPVVFGPKYASFKEAVDLVNLQGAFPIHTKDELETAFLHLINDETFYSKASATCHDYLKSQVGATEIIMKGFKNALFL